ncbi:MAG: extracellular solute-binding protein [Paenibacillus sp.]|nr:extracellular solute-binding protein [Paenibacillus sp.]
MKRRISLLCLMAAMLVMVPLLQACGKAGDSGGKVELTMSAWGNPAELKVYQRAIDAYEEKNKNVSVKLIPIPSDGYEQKLLTELSGGAGADVFYVGDTTMAKLVKSNSVLPLADFLKTDASYTKAEEYAEGLWGAAKQGEELYGITVDCNPYVMYYNIKLFKEAGLKTPQQYFDEGTWNWDTFKEVTATFKSMNKYGFVQEKGSLPMLNWVWSNGGNMYDKEGSYVYDKDPKAQEAIAYMHGNYGRNTKGGICHLCLAVCGKDHPGTIMGWCGLDGTKNHAEPEIFILLDEAYRNRGYGTQCVKELLRIAAEDYALSGVHGGCARENVASARMMEKGGMAQYGTEDNGDPLFRFAAKEKTGR